MKDHLKGKERGLRRKLSRIEADVTGMKPTELSGGFPVFAPSQLSPLVARNTDIDDAIDTHATLVSGIHNLDSINTILTGITTPIVDPRLVNTPNTGDKNTDDLITALKDIILSKNFGRRQP